MVKKLSFLASSLELMEVMISDDGVDDDVGVGLCDENFVAVADAAHY